ncbi:MAG TPA: hypothetical protein VGG64_07570 [Pirellulales bacterium]
MRRLLDEMNVRSAILVFNYEPRFHRDISPVTVDDLENDGVIQCGAFVLE